MSTPPPRLMTRGGQTARLLASAKADAVPASARPRALASVALAAGAAAAPRAAAAAAASAKASMLVKAVAVVLVGGGAIASAIALSSNGSSTPPIATHLPGASTTGASAIQASTPPAVSKDSPSDDLPVAPLEPSSTPATRVQPASMSTGPAAPPSVVSPTRGNRGEPRAATDLDRELAALDEAKKRLVTGDAEGALARLDEFGRAHPHALLEQEALALRVRALAARGDRAGALAVRRRLAERYPSSPQLAPLRDLLGDDP